MLHVGFWTTVSSAVLIKFLYHNFSQEKTKNHHVDE
jgi:hypothetical protein